MYVNEPPVVVARPGGAAIAPRARHRAAAPAVSVVIALALAAWAPAAAAFCVPTGNARLTFGSYSPLGPAVQATAVLGYVCFGAPSAVSIELPRTIRSGGNALGFELYTDPTRTTVFPGSPGLSIDPNGSQLVIYATLPPQDAAAGSYSGQLAVTFGNPDFFSFSPTLNVSATAVGVCAIEAATLDFGGYDPTATAPRDASATMTLSCTRGTRYTVTLGTGNAASSGARHMAAPSGDLLEYELYTDPARSQVWNTTTGTVTGVAPSTASVPVTVYGRIRAQQGARAGDYSDFVQSTVNF